MSAHIVFAVPCLWQEGIHSLQDLPSILLIKQWLCTQAVQGTKNATQRDKNIKQSAIWGGRVPNNDSLEIMGPLFFSPVSPHPKNMKKKQRIWKKCMKKKYVWVSISPSASVTLVWIPSPMWQGNGEVRVAATGGWENCQINGAEWIKTPPPALNMFPCNLFSSCFCYPSTRLPHDLWKGSSKLKSSPHKILFEINSVTFTLQK